MINPHCFYCNKQIAPTIHKDEIPSIILKLITCPNCNIDYHWITSLTSLSLWKGLYLWRYKVPIKYNLYAHIYIDENIAYINTDQENILVFNDISSLLLLDIHQLKSKVLKLLPFI